MKIKLNKLQLNKKVVTELNDNEQGNIKGGTLDVATGGGTGGNTFGDGIDCLWSEFGGNGNCPSEAPGTCDHLQTHGPECQVHTDDDPGCHVFATQVTECGGTCDPNMGC